MADDPLPDPPQPDCKQPDGLNLTDFFPQKVAQFVGSPDLQKMGVAPVAESLAQISANPCGGPVALPLIVPFPAVAKITCTKHDHANLFGSAFLVTPQVLLTAAHNLLPRLDPDVANHVRVNKVVVDLPKAGGGFTSVIATGFEVSAAWMGGNVSGRDYGVIFIPGAAAYNGTISPKTMLPSALFPAYKASVTGYPAASTRLYANAGNFSLDEANNLIGYQLSTCAGQSGGPVYILFNGQFVAVAVHAYGPSPGLPISLGPLVDATMCAELTGWIGHPVCV